MEAFAESYIWIIVLSFVIAFFLAFGVGANDVANSFGTSVGSKVLTLRQACILATIFETLGAVLMGHQVSDTVRTGVFEPSIYENQEKLLMLGYLSALIGGAVWNLVATFLRLPISGTHSIIASVLGFTLVAKGIAHIKLGELLKIVLSWFISPLLSGFISVLLFLLIKQIILSKDNPVESGLRTLPFFYGITILINLFSTLHGGSSMLNFDKLLAWHCLAISTALSLIVALLVWFLFVPKQRKTIAQLDQVESKKSPPATKGSDDDDSPGVAQLFKYLQILTACFGSFAHGGNDVSNAVGPLVAIMVIWKDGNVWQDMSKATDINFYLMLYGGFGITVGLWLWGRKVIKTVGEDLTKIVPSSGFTIEIAAAFTVLLATKCKLPVSTTHCKVGSVVAVGMVREPAKKSVDWKLFTNIILAWVLTVPISAALAALFMFIFKMMLLQN